MNVFPEWTTAQVVGLYEAELARCTALLATEAETVAKLIDEVDKEAQQPLRRRLGDDDARFAARQEQRRIYFAEKRSALQLRAAAKPNPIALDGWRGLRTRLFEKLQAEKPPPERDAGEDDEDLGARHKAHNKKLWQWVDKLVASAGITEGGRT